jgi:hypothetical protein
MIMIVILFISTMFKKNMDCLIISIGIKNKRMEQHVSSYIFIDYRGRLWKVVAIFDVTGTNLHQKLLY